MASILQSSTSLQIAFEAMHWEGVGLPATDSQGVGIWLCGQVGPEAVVVVASVWEIVVSVGDSVKGVLVKGDTVAKAALLLCAS